MEKFRRIFVIVADSLGVGAMPDSPAFGDVGVNTLGHISQTADSFHIPTLQKLGLANITPLKQVPPASAPLAYYGKLCEKSNGKDTMTGHWEMMGLEVTRPFKTFTETGFPPELIRELEKRTGRTVIGNKSASGTEILDELAEEEIATGHMIVYTSADSVMQICGNEETFGLDELYRCCEIARELTMKEEWRVGRVIARPYTGKKKGEFKRTSNRHDYALKPFGKTALDALKASGLSRSMNIFIIKKYDFREKNRFFMSVPALSALVDLQKRNIAHFFKLACSKSKSYRYKRIISSG